MAPVVLLSDRFSRRLGGEAMGRRFRSTIQTSVYEGLRAIKGKRRLPISQEAVRLPMFSDLDTDREIYEYTEAGTDQDVLLGRIPVVYRR